MPRKESLSGRERVLLALEHRETDRIPVAMVCAGINPPARRGLEHYLKHERDLDVNAYLAPLIDIQSVAPAYTGPRLAPGEDIWGVCRQPVSYGPGTYNEISHYPLADAQSVDDLKRHRWPSPDGYDYTVLPERIAAIQARGERCIMVANGNIFETAWYMRGFERMCVDFMLHPDLAHAILERVTTFYIAYFKHMLRAAKGGVDLAFTADDIGGQTGLLMSLPMWETFLKPYHIRLNRAIHDCGVRVIYHSDGAIMAAVDGLIDMGIDILQALQFSAAGMDPAALKQTYGNRLRFEGGVSVQTTMLSNDPEAVRQEVQDLIRTLGQNGGYILGPSHAIQAGTPPENIVALFDTARDFYPF